MVKQVKNKKYGLKLKFALKFSMHAHVEFMLPRANQRKFECSNFV